MKEESDKAGLKLNIQFKRLTWQLVPSFMANRRGKVEAVTDFIWGAPKSLQMVTAAIKLKDAYSLEENYDKPRQHIKKK